MNWFRKLIRNVLASFALSVPNFEHGKDEASQTAKAPLEQEKNKDFARGGTLEPVRKQQGITIAGGPGSQRIGDTFMALPQAERDRMIAARKGVIRRVEGVDQIGDQGEGATSYRGMGTDRIAAGLRKVEAELKAQGKRK